MKRDTGIEPVTYRLDSFAVGILKLVSLRGFEPLPPDPKSGTLPSYAIER